MSTALAMCQFLICVLATCSCVSVKLTNSTYRYTFEYPAAWKVDVVNKVNNNTHRCAQTVFAPSLAEFGSMCVKIQQLLRSSFLCSANMCFVTWQSIEARYVMAQSIAQAA